MRSACVVGWPVEHSRSPLIHDYWIKQHGLTPSYRREEVPPEAFADFVTHAGRARLCRRQRHAAAQGGCARAVGTGRPRARGRCRQYALARWRAAAFDQYRRRGLHRQSRRQRAGLGSRTRRSGGAGRGRRGARRGLRSDRTRLRRIDVVNRSSERARKRCASGSAPRYIPRTGTALPHLLGRAVSAGQRDLARHGRAADARDRSDSAAPGCRGGRPRLRAARDRACWRPRKRAASLPPTGSACCCIRRCGASSCGSACVRR